MDSSQALSDIYIPPLTIPIHTEINESVLLSKIAEYAISNPAFLDIAKNIANYGLNFWTLLTSSNSLISSINESIGDQNQLVQIFSGLYERMTEKAQHDPDWTMSISLKESQYDENFTTVLNLLTEVVFYIYKTKSGTSYPSKNEEMDAMFKAIIKDMFFNSLEDLYGKIYNLPEGHIENFKKVISCLSGA